MARNNCSDAKGAAAPLVKPTLRGILPHGSEVPWGPIPLRSEGLDDSPRWRAEGAEFVGDEFLFSLRRTLGSARQIEPHGCGEGNARRAKR